MDVLSDIKDDFYLDAYKLDMDSMCYTQNTEDEINKILSYLGNKIDNILDIGCGYGRHSIELGKKGLSVTGIDINNELICEANRRAATLNLSNVIFENSDIRQLNSNKEYDCVLNLYDGAIGYLESDEENEKVFDKISQLLKRGGINIIHLMNGEFIRERAPFKDWSYNSEMIVLDNYHMNESRDNYVIQEASILKMNRVNKWELRKACIRTYSVEEISNIYNKYNMNLVGVFDSFNFSNKLKPGQLSHIMELTIVGIKL